MKPFLSKFSQEVIHKMTNTPFSIAKDQFWLYWLFKLELIPGGWSAQFYLEVNSKEQADWLKKRNIRWIYSGDGYPDEAVKKAYQQINKKWLENGSKKGQIEVVKWKKEYKKIEEARKQQTKNKTVKEIKYH